MKRIRYLGLAAAMALVLTASVGAASASASAFETTNLEGESAYPSFIEGEAIESLWFTFAGARMYTCEDPIFHASPSAPIGAISSYSGKLPCNDDLGYKWTLELNGCEFTISSDAEVEADKFEASFGIGPANCGPVKLVGPMCGDAILIYPGEQLPPYNPTYLSNQENGELPDTVSAEISGASFKAGQCGAAVANFHGSIGLKAEMGGTQIDLEVDQTGAYMGAGGFEAEEYPTLLQGPQDPANKHMLTIANGWKLECANADFEAVPTAASTSLSVEAGYSGCKTVPVFGISHSVAVSMNSCNYVFNSGGTMDVACSKEGDVIGFAISTSKGYACTIKIGAQKGVSGVEYATVGEGNERGIELDLSLKGLKYTTTNSFPCGSGGSGVYTGTTTLLN